MINSSSQQGYPEPSKTETVEKARRDSKLVFKKEEDKKTKSNDMKSKPWFRFLRNSTGGSVIILAWFLVVLGKEGFTLFTSRADRPSPRMARVETGDPEENMNTVEIIELNKYPAEEYTVQTDDGYILGLHRIPRGSGQTKDSTKTRIPVLVMHGLLCSSVVWVDNTKNISLAYLLADVGYDVWLGNVRGNTYSQDHVKLSPTDKDFWEFSWTEHALHDLPATIDFVLKKTRFRRLLYVAHSMGTTMMFSLLSEKPEYNDKVKGVIALAPVATVGSLKGPLRTLANNLWFLETSLSFFNVYSVLPNSFLTRRLANIFCRQDGFRETCDNVVFQLAGYDPGQLNQTRLPVYLSHSPAGTSLKNVFHYGQMVQSKQFVPYDYGTPEMNMKKYGKIRPPPYDLSKVTTPVALFWGENDYLASSVDVTWLADRLPNLVLNYKVPYRQFSHVDFMWSKNSRPLLYNKVVETLAQMWRMGKKSSSNKG